MIKYRINILEALKKAGYSSYRIRQEKIMGESTMQRLRKGDIAITVDSLGVICNLLKCQPGDLLEWIPDE